MRYLSDRHQSPVRYASTGMGGDAHHELAQNFAAYGDVTLADGARRELLNGDDDTLLVSSEGMSAYNPRQVADLVAALRRTGDGVSVHAVAWVRRADLYLESSLAQQVKSGTREIGPGMDEKINTAKRTNLESISPWIDVLGASNVTVNAFDRSQWRDGRLWNAWWDVLGVDDPMAESDLPDDVATKNESPSAMVLAVLSELVRRLGERGVRSRNSWRFICEITDPLAARSREMNVPAICREKLSLFTPDERADLIERRAVGDRKLAEQLGLSSPFYPSPDVTKFADGNRHRVVDPESDEHPREWVETFRELLDYAESLADQCIATNNGVFSK